MKHTCLLRLYYNLFELVIWLIRPGGNGESHISFATYSDLAVATPLVNHDGADFGACLIGQFVFDSRFLGQEFGIGQILMQSVFGCKYFSTLDQLRLPRKEHNLGVTADHKVTFCIPLGYKAIAVVETFGRHP